MGLWPLYALVGPLALGMATVFHEGGFNVDSTYDTIARLGITNLAGSPTAYRLLAGDGPEKAKRVRGQLRVVSSAGEPLNPETIRWFARHLDAPIQDHYGQTELGIGSRAMRDSRRRLSKPAIYAAATRWN
ncbi:AMP-binding protein [Sphingobium sp. AN558]|uniref:AMP-binding protein n=1 Tax=Sphingobium sp. AN558 TaxID=3133442 RepID=UPI0030BF9A39